MSDLISRSALLKEIKEFTDISSNYFSNPALLEKIIEIQPIAYNVDAVVGEIEEIKSFYCDDDDWDKAKNDAFRDAITIVRKGGVKK